MHRRLAKLALVVLAAAAGTLAHPDANAQAICGWGGGSPYTAVPQQFVVEAQRPGRRFIPITFNGNGRDWLVAIVDDAPGLPADRMILELDLDPNTMSGWDKAIEARRFCRGTLAGRVVAQMLSGFGVGCAFVPLVPANDYRSGCTRTQAITIVQGQVHELWFRKPGFLGVWFDAGVLDQSFWSAFAGRRVRFVWRSD